MIEVTRRRSPVWNPMNRKKAEIKVMPAKPIAPFISGVLEAIGENPQRDGLLRTPERVEKALTAAKTTRVILTKAEGAGEHTHAGALARAHQVLFDWLDTTLSA